jgi:hypothetical protein
MLTSFRVAVYMSAASFCPTVCFSYMLYGSICGNVVTHRLSCCDSQIHDFNTATGIMASRDITLRPLDMGGGMFVWRRTMGAEAHQPPILYVQPPLNVRLYWSNHLTSMSPLYVHPIFLCCFLHLIPLSITSRLIYKSTSFMTFFATSSHLYTAVLRLPPTLFYTSSHALLFRCSWSFLLSLRRVSWIWYKIKTVPGSAYIKTLVETRPNPVVVLVCMQRSLLIIHVVTIFVVVAFYHFQ